MTQPQPRGPIVTWQMARDILDGLAADCRRKATALFAGARELTCERDREAVLDAAAHCRVYQIGFEQASQRLCETMPAPSPLTETVDR